MSFSTLDKIAKYLGLAILIAAPAAILSGAVVQVSDKVFGVAIVQTSSTTATQCTPPAGAKRYHELCVVNLGSSSSENVWVSTFSTTDETSNGWPVRGTEKECHDWHAAIPVYLWHSDTESSKEARCLFAE